MPFLLKDLGPALAGHTLSFGSRFYADHVPAQDDVFVARLKAAGLQIFGKTNTPELGMRPVTEAERLYGAARNPWDPALTPGGSSGGAAAAVAAGVVPAAHGNDIGGSLRIPASCCGVFGFKPSRGRMPAGALRLDTAGRHEHGGLHHPQRARQRRAAGRHDRRRPNPAVRPAATFPAARRGRGARPGAPAHRDGHGPDVGPHRAPGLPRRAG